VARNPKGRSAAPPTREAARRGTILRAAVEVFARKGYHGCRIADVAKEAGVAYGLVYHYFQSKEELLGSVFEASWTGFVGRVAELAQAPGALEEKVRGITHLAFEAYRVDPRGVKVLILEIARSPAAGRVKRHSAFQEVVRIIEGMFQAAQARGELGPEFDPRLCAAVLFGSIEVGLTSFVVGLFDSRDEAALARAEAQIARTFLRGVLTPAAELEWKSDTSDITSQVPRPS
jgi:TetR/AcrR family transcriptional regulator, fatty acid metabolism regulator protein